jgi:cytochrome c
MKKQLFMFPVAVVVLTAFVRLPINQSTQTAPEIPAEVNALLTKNGCAACHALDRKLVGPAWQDIAAKKYSKKRILELVAKPDPNNWPGFPPMAPQATVPKEELGKIAMWLVKMK